MRELDLPSSPLKEGEKRAAKWLELYGSEQTEIDALATLRPDELERIAREAVAPYFDAGLAERVRDAEAGWQEQVRAEIANQIDEDRLDRLKVAPKPRSTSSGKSTPNSRRSPRDIEISEPPELPEADMDALEEAQDERRSSVLIDSDMDFAEAMDRLRAHSEMAARRRLKKARRA